MEMLPASSTSSPAIKGAGRLGSLRPALTPMPEHPDPVATTETIFREMNEWTEEASDERLGTDRPMDAYLCECADGGCTDPIQLTRQEYEDVRSVPIRFVIALNHENPEIDRVLLENQRFATVEKFYGAPAKVARATDPRR
jgi:hypothetical protein